MDYVIESVMLAFVMGGIVGAVAALSLRASRYWGKERSRDIDARAVPVNTDLRRQRR